jgi:hypothetical protein
VYGPRDAYNLEENWVSPIFMGLNQAPSPGPLVLLPGVALTGLGLAAVLPTTVSQVTRFDPLAAGRFAGIMFAFAGLGGASGKLPPGLKSPPDHRAPHSRPSVTRVFGERFVADHGAPCLRVDQNYAFKIPDQLIARSQLSALFHAVLCSIASIRLSSCLL